MDIFEIDRKLKENLDLIALKNTEISELQKNHNILLHFYHLCNIVVFYFVYYSILSYTIIIYVIIYYLNYSLC